MRGSGFWRAVLVVAVVFAMVWACVIVWWRAGDATPGGTRMLVWLVVVPVVILSTLWIGAHLRRRQRAAAGADEPGANADGTGVPDDAEPAQRPLGILAAAVNLPELPRPELHPELRDRDGLPVLAAFNAELVTRPLADRLQAGAGERMADEHLRALALLEPVALELFDSAARLLPPLPEAEERVIAGLRRSAKIAPDAGGSVHVVVLLPQDVPPSLRTGCEDWLRELASGAGLDPGRSTFEVGCGQDADGTSRRIEALVEDEPRKDTHWQLLLASASSIGERALHALIASGRLASSRNIEGLVPGEGAAGLLLRPATGVRPRQDVHEPVLAAIRTAVFVHGSSPRDAARATGELLGGLMGMTGVPRDDVAMVLSDADQRPSRSVEAAVAASTACPGLDPAGACPALGVASGHLGHVAPLALLALAWQQAREADAPVLTLSVASASTRSAALVRIADPIKTPQTTPDAAGMQPDLAA